MGPPRPTAVQGLPCQRGHSRGGGRQGDRQDKGHRQTQTKKQVTLPLQGHTVLLVRRFGGAGVSRVPNLPRLVATSQGNPKALEAVGLSERDAPADS